MDVGTSLSLSIVTVVNTLATQPLKDTDAEGLFHTSTPRSLPAALPRNTTVCNTTMALPAAAIAPPLSSAALRSNELV
jgi:hypothetical protein